MGAGLRRHDAEVETSGVRHERSASERASFRREWNFAFALVAVAAVVLLAVGSSVAGMLAAALAVGAVVARWAATRRKGRAFYD